jgi:hypothetical protein
VYRFSIDEKLIHKTTGEQIGAGFNGFLRIPSVENRPVDRMPAEGWSVEAPGLKDK